MPDLQWEIKWDLELPAFRKDIEDMIERCTAEDKSIALPIFPKSRDHFIDVVKTMLAAIHCEKCPAPCCKYNPGGQDSTLSEKEWVFLRSEHGSQAFREDHSLMDPTETGYFLKMPCAFLNHTPNVYRCSIYEDRPLCCVLYPYQAGGRDDSGAEALSVASDCPAARRVALTVYLTEWQIRRAVERL